MTSGAKTCTKCERTKPLDEFPLHARTRDGRDSWCRDCSNRGRKPTSKRYIRNRARQRATAELVKLHYDEFCQLLEAHTEYVADELEMLRDAAASQREHDVDAPRLKPGPARKNQDVVDRLDVARCAHCAPHHDRGHICPMCGATPEEVAAEPEPWKTTRDIDEVAVERAITGDKAVARTLGIAERDEAIRRLYGRMTREQIANQLCISKKTVERHLDQRRDAAS